MIETFVPDRPEKMVNTEITAKEAHLIKCLREVNFGKIIVHKANGKLVRVETTESVLLTEEKGLTIGK